MTSINNSGKIVGDYFDATSQHGFLYQNNFTIVDVVGAKYTIPEHIDYKGKVAGIYVDVLDEYHGFVGR